MSHGGDIDKAARQVDPVVGWDAFLATGMPLDALMRKEEAGAACEFCGSAPDVVFEGQIKRETLDLLMAYLFSDKRPEAWELVAHRAYAVAMAFFPHLLTVTGPEGEKIPMTLHRLGIVFEHQKIQSARATWQARIKRMVTDLIHATGSKAKAAFQKNPEACANMSKAQKGNQNRKKKGRTTISIPNQSNQP